MSDKKVAAVKLTFLLDRAASAFEKEAANLGVPEDLARDFVRRIDAVSDLVDRRAGLKRDKSGNLIKSADFNPEEIGREVGGPLVQDADEDWMKPHFSQQENREISELQESGALSPPKVNAPERAPAPGRQASLDDALNRLSKLASEGDVHAIGSVIADLKVCAGRMDNSKVDTAGTMATSVRGLASALGDVQEKLISASAQGLGLVVAGEADKALQAAQEVSPYMADLADRLMVASGDASPTALLATEEMIKANGGKLSRLVQLATKIVKECHSTMGDLLKGSDD